MARTGFLFFLFALFSFVTLQAQEFLHAGGKYIYKNSEEVILRGIGTGNWMLQEGYMMQTSDVAPTQHEFREQLIQTIGETRTDSFYNAWLAWHFARADVDSMKSWGFNSVRAAMHYKWFTLPIEEEPVPNENTWLYKGFVLIDSLLDWCSNNEMYLILDLHGAPGGQGTDAAISDYDPEKPSLWESQENKNKTIALWRKLAERYCDEPWIGGYDLINEPNWDFDDPNHTPLWDLLTDITEAIREADTNHIIIIEGNWFANDYTGVPPPWDDNMVFSFHKYWTTNTSTSLDWIINMRDNYNIPIWLGESGENSNTWFTNLIALCETNHIGWSWWPIKKPGVNNPLRVEVNTSYTSLIEYWRGNVTAPTEEEAFQAVLEFAGNHRTENCIFQKDVIDAMIRQPFSTTTLPYSGHKPEQTIYAVDYDLGRNNHAYFDKDTGDYHGSTGGYWMIWNQGGAYRNDGVDIETCTDSEESNGYNVGWTEDGEWLLYTMTTDSLTAYTLNIRYASGSNNGIVRVMANNVPITGNISLPATGDWQNWSTYTIQSVILPAGILKIKLLFVQGGVNVNYFKFTGPVSVDSVEFQPVAGETSTDGTGIYLYLNKDITSPVQDISASDFQVTANDMPIAIVSVIEDTAHARSIQLELEQGVHYGNTITLSYTGTSIEHNEENLSAFSDLPVINNLPIRYTIPGRIQAEDFFENHGFELEICQDEDGGYNTAYAASGDYLDYRIYIPETREYTMNFRVATAYSNAELIVLTGNEESFTSLDTIRFTSTGDWQNWQTQSTSLTLNEGRYTLRLLVKQGEHNLNWFEFELPVSIAVDQSTKNKLKLYPNPAQNCLIIELPEGYQDNLEMSIFNLTGVLIENRTISEMNPVVVDISLLHNGTYFIKLTGSGPLYVPCIFLVYR